MEKLKVDMDKVAQIGGTRIAAPPGNSRAAVSLDNAANYYREALEMGEKMGVQPLLELWGTHPVLGPLSHGIYVTVAAGRADASLLLDVFHLYKSGTPFAALKQINGASLHVMHLNDYPQAADPSTLNDGNRIYPGDGVAPLRQILRDLRDNGFRGCLSLELFNQRILDAQRRREPEDRDGEDPSHGALGDGVASFAGIAAPARVAGRQCGSEIFSIAGRHRLNGDPAGRGSRSGPGASAPSASGPGRSRQ